MLNEIKIEAEIVGKEVPGHRTYTSGDIYYRFSIMWKGTLAGRVKISFFNIVLHGSMAEQFYASWIWSKGRKVLIHGALSIWKSGENRYFTDIVAIKIETIGSAPKKEEPKPKPKVEDEVIPFE